MQKVRTLTCSELCQLLAGSMCQLLMFSVLTLTQGAGYSAMLRWSRSTLKKGSWQMHHSIFHLCTPLPTLQAGYCSCSQDPLHLGRVLESQGIREAACSITCHSIQRNRHLTRGTRVRVAGAGPLW